MSFLKALPVPRNEVTRETTQLHNNEISINTAAQSNSLVKAMHCFVYAVSMLIGC